MEDRDESISCPHCGHDVPLKLNPLEKQVLAAVRKLNRHSPTASTRAIALEVSLSPAQTKRYLIALERKGRIWRVGMKGGWKSAA